MLTFRDAAFEDAFARFHNAIHTKLKVLLPLVVTATTLRAIVLSGNPDPVILYVNIGIAAFEAFLLATAIGGVFLARRDDDSLARQTAIAFRHELLGAIAVAAVGTTNGCSELLLRRQACAAERCHFLFWLFPAITLFGVNIVMRPQVRWAVALDVAIVLVTLAAMVAIGGDAPMDIAICAFLLLTCAALAVVVSYIAESAERRRFVNSEKLIDASSEIQEFSATTRLLVESVMPRELVASPAMAARTHHASDATVGICDIADFATWSCGLLIGDVVSALHSLMCAVDVGADEHGVVRAMTYGDSAVVCAGLLSECPESDVRVTAWGNWLLKRGEEATRGCRYRVSVVSGALSGGLVGGGAKRFALSGPALDAARAGLRLTAASAMTAQPRGTASTPSTLRLSAAPPSNPGSSSGVSHSLAFSPVTLRFADAAARVGLDAFVAEREARTRLVAAAVPVVVFGAFLAVMLLERASPDPARHHTAHPGPMVGLAAAVVFGLFVLLLRWCTELPLAVDYALTAACVAGGVLSAGFSDCVWVFTGAAACMLVLGTPTLFGRLPWLGQVAVQGLAVVVPAVASEVFLARHHRVGAPDRLVVTIALIGVFLWARYFSSRAACQLYVGATEAAVAVKSAKDCAATCDAMLRGLLPWHIPVDAVLGGLLSAASHRDTPMEHVRRSWKGLSVLQVECRQHHTADLTALWADVAPTIQRAGGGILEMVEASGDVFLVAGPFDASPTDARCRDAATNRVALIRELWILLVGRCAFTAVATAGSAYGALLGSSGLTFRLFGAVVRESNALLAAAPANAAGPAAFATESFRRQHANFGVSARPAKGAAGMSTAVLSTCADVNSSPLGFDAAAETGDFRAALRWRMCGVGVVIVSSIKL
jgi:hypothetical protein